MKDLTQIRLSDLWKEVKSEDDLWEDLKQETREHLKMLIEGCLQEDQLRSLRLPRYARKKPRLDYRNGYYKRDIESGLGLIEDIKVPRNRIIPYEPSLFKKYKRKEIKLIELIKDAFLSGLSTRKVGEVLEGILGYKISATTVSNIAKSLDIKVREFHTKALEDKYAYLFLNGINLNVKCPGARNKKTVLAAYGITKKGDRELISFRIDKSESEMSWYLFVDSLFRRGLKGSSLNLIVVDGSPSLMLAVKTVYPFTPVQRCWVHKLRNVAVKLPKKGSEDCLAAAKKIYLAENKKEAASVYKNWVSGFKDRYPKAVECLTKDIEDLLTFFDFDKNIRVKIRTTNIIERSFKEVRRRTRPIGCFENDASVNRIIFGVISGLNKNWKSKPLKEFTQKT
ncbi:MAG: IS256 family transposase [Actinobacteria bacterium]|nr:IS256 family transposase [Actinomycetota bacterium]